MVIRVGYITVYSLFVSIVGRPGRNFRNPIDWLFAYEGAILGSVLMWILHFRFRRPVKLGTFIATRCTYR